MREGLPAIRAGTLAAPLGSHLLLRGAADLLLRVEQPSSLGTWAYAPVLIKLHHEPRAEDWLQLEACRWLLGQAQGYLPAGQLWLGRQGAAPAHRLSRDGQDLHAFARAWRTVEQLMLHADAPPIWFDRSCLFCHWHQDCTAQARDQGDLAMLPGLDQKQATTLRSASLGRLEQLARASHIELQRLMPALAPGTVRRIQLGAQAVDSGLALPLASRPVILPDPRIRVLFLDLESTPATGQPWAFGWLLEGCRPQIALLAPWPMPAAEAPLALAAAELHVLDSGAAAWRLIAQSARAHGAHVVHWGDFERTQIRQHAPPDVRDELLPRLHDAHRLLTRAYALPIARTAAERGSSLKNVGAWLGFAWLPGADNWRVAWQAFSRWSAQPASLEQLAPAVGYLAADLHALALAWRWLREQEKEQADE
jgi:uncharacterized protein